VYIDGLTMNAAVELQKLGGARAILATAPDSKARSSLIDGLGINGSTLVVGAGAGPMEIAPTQLLRVKKHIQGWFLGTATDSEDTRRCAEMIGVRARIEKYPLERVNEAYTRMMSGKAEFRLVLTM
jgi:D-arabinose 1-dehydrogenase-like Zn-dependent alcohol dehydrogenase